MMKQSYSFYPRGTHFTPTDPTLLTIYYFQLLSYWDAVQMLIVIQFQTFYKEINMLTKTFKYKEDESNRGITEVYTPQFILLNLSFGQVMLLSELEDETLLRNIIKVLKVVKKSFRSFLACDWVSL